MKRFTALLVLLFLAYQATAQTTFQASASARWQLPCTSNSPAFNPPGPCLLIPTTQAATWLKSDVKINWGEGEVKDYNSTLVFTSYSGVALPVGQPGVAIGKLTHLNFPLKCFNNCSKNIPTNFVLDLLFNVSVGSPAVYATFNGIYTMVLDETPNIDGRPNYPTSTAGCPYNPNEISWVAAIGGYNPSYPCCPYFSANTVPGSLGPQFPQNGPCSDRLAFPNGVSSTSPFTLQGTQYTVVISGFAKNRTQFDSRINYFTSQENQQQEAYIYAYVVRACSSNAGCDDGKNCTIDSCDTSKGVCVNTPVAASTACNDPINTGGKYEPTNTCMKYKCSVGGSCLGSATNQNGVCTTTTPRPSGSTTDCTTSACNTGVCVWVQSNSGSCTLPTTPVTDGKCQRRTCVVGTCKTQSTNEGLNCVANDPNQQTAISKYSNCNRALCTSGSCRFSIIPGSCSSITTSVCNRRICRSISLGGATVGSCLGSFVAGSCASGLAYKECNVRRCISKTGATGSCTYNTASGSCSGVGARKDCTARICSGGACQYSFNPSQGSCGIGIIPILACKARTCNTQGTCIQGDANNGGSCQFVGTPADCTRRICQSGVCQVVASTTQGSCRNALVARQCKARSCNTQGTCRYLPGADGGSCTDIATPVDCKRRTCTSGTCVSSTSLTQGSCLNSGLLPVQCLRRVCNTATGVCQALTQDGGSCTGPAIQACKKRNCQVGTCRSILDTALTQSSGSCAFGTVLKECYKRVCSTLGVCQYQFSDGGSCTNGGAVIAKSCSRRTCASGVCNYQFVGGSCSIWLNYRQCRTRNCGATVDSCGYVAANTGGSCTDRATRIDCQRRICTTNLGGTCQYVNSTTQGSCFSRTAVACYRRRCVSGACNLLLDQNLTNFTGSCTFGTVAKPCYRRVCSTTGVCQYATQDSGSCASGAAATIKSCMRRFCSAGTCKYQFNGNQGSCSSSQDGTPVGIRSCQRRSCNTQGTCVYSPNGNQGSCQFQPLGAAVSTVSCMRRICTSTGSCGYSFYTNAAGSCSTGAGGAATSIQDCNRRQCTTRGSCVYAANTVQGSCTASYLECSIRQCVASNLVLPATCGYTAISTGSCLGTAISDCRTRRCSSGVCRTTANPAQGSCTTVATSACNKRKCTAAGVCVGSWNGLTGSCINLNAQECYARRCTNKAGVGSCSFSVQNGGSCVGPFSAGLVAARALCSRRLCNAGTCAYNFVTGACNAGYTTNDGTCFTQRCRRVTSGGGGTCSTSARIGRSCSAISGGPCSSTACDATGYCSRVYTAYPSGTPCTDASKGPTGAFCSPQKCDGLGSCVNRPDLKDGVSCLTPPDSAAALCITSQCSNGVCQDISDLTKNGTFKCKANQPNEDPCSTYFCRFRSGSSTNHLGTCVRQVDTSLVGLACTIPNNPDSTIDQRCYKLTCSPSGQCIKTPAATNTYCATPSNTIITNGYGCSQYQCSAGTCNTAVAKPITNGSSCAGSITCDPSLPGCLSECQRFVCYNGICTLDYFKEGQNCTYIKYLTARDGSLVEARDSEGGNNGQNDCTSGKCYQGRCTAVSAKNGTACGNRTKLNDLCYGDYCDDSGRCVHTGRRNCAGVLPLPSVCWDVTCEASTGDCVLVANGVVDCSCINDCTACTAAFSKTNYTRKGDHDRKLGCWWCTGQNGKGAGCFNRYLPNKGDKEIPAPKNHGPCYKNSDPCGGGGGITGGQIAGIVVGILGLSSLAALAIALGALLVRYFTAAGTPPANASLTDLAFDKNVKNNVFYEGACLENFSAVYAEPRFITS